MILYKSPDNLRVCKSKAVRWHRHIGAVTTVLEGLITALNIWHCVEEIFSHILRKILAISISISNRSLTCNIKGFHSGVAEDLNLLEFYAVLTGKYLSIFWSDVLSLSTWPNIKVPVWIKIQQMQQYADIYSLQNYSTCFGCHNTHQQEY